MKKTDEDVRDAYFEDGSLKDDQGKVIITKESFQQLRCKEGGLVTTKDDKENIIRFRVKR